MRDPDRFERKFFTGENEVTRIGDGSVGGKARGLIDISTRIKERFEGAADGELTVGIPRMSVIATDFFDAFLSQADLRDTAHSGLPDDRITKAFLKADLPARLVGDLRALAVEAKTPLAIRSSSLLEDAMHEPFAGIYGTKMIPNNQPSADERFAKLVEAVKFVWASAFFREAKSYLDSVGRTQNEEKMAVIVQEVVGQRFGDRYYPHVSGVARSYNYYPTGSAEPDEGVVDLALGMGKTIVDGGRVWSFSPAHPNSPPPFNDLGDLLKNTQTGLWAVNMGKPPAYDPFRETEYMTKAGLKEAEYDGTLRFVASTYDPGSDRVYTGIGRPGPRIVNFRPLLTRRDVDFSELVRDLLALCEKSVGAAVEIEFALTLNSRTGMPSRLGFLQVRPMAVSTSQVDIPVERMTNPGVLLASENALGNGTRSDLEDIVYLRRDTFDLKHSREIAAELGDVNARFLTEDRKYVLIGFGRFGTSESWLGVPVTWAQISGARAIVESTLPGLEIEFSQGSHFFHNVISLGVFSFTMRHSGIHTIDWNWLEAQPAVSETRYVRHIRVHPALTVEVDGQSRRGLISIGESE